MYFNDIRHVAGGCHEFVESTRLGLVQSDPQGDLDLIAKCAPIYDRAVCANKPCTDHPFQTPGAGGRCDTGKLGQFRRAELGIVLVVTQNASISVVKHEFTPI